MVDSESIDANVDEFLKLVSDLCSVGVAVTDEVQAILLLCSLPSKYNQLKETLK
uniref:Retrovirus-related Pol polyprotein from transposon TNT 1-94 n=1 Tax=Brassica oleracea var. oleracea TaxID=109376 RepID=A0A0D3AZ41_BRAOL